MITYNHEAFIRQALESVLMQQIDFELEIIVADDASTDGTAEIVREIAARTPAKFRLMLRSENVGPARNFESLMHAARGELIAYLEGDDCWTSRVKLARQVELLRQYPSCSGCFHDVEIDVVGQHQERRERFLGPLRNQFVRFEDMLERNIVPSSSVLFRADDRFPLPAWHSTLKFGDWTLHLLNAERGPYVYVDDVLGLYRVHAGGIWSLKRKSYQIAAILEAFAMLRLHFRDYEAALAAREASYRWQLSRALIAEGNPVQAARAVSKVVRESPARDVATTTRELASTLVLGARRMAGVAARYIGLRRDDRRAI